MIPVIVGNLVPEMAEQSAIGFGQGLALAFALEVGGFRDMERYKPAGMPGDDRRSLRQSIGRRREKVECEAVRILHPRGERQTKLQQRIEEPMLGGLDL